MVSLFSTAAVAILGHSWTGHGGVGAGRPAGRGGLLCPGLKSRASLVKELLVFVLELGSERLRLKGPLWDGIEAFRVVVLKSFTWISRFRDGRVASRGSASD